MVIPKPLQPLYNGWMTVSRGIGVVMSSIILTLLWVTLFGAYAIVLKCVNIFGRPRPTSSHWSDVSQEHQDFTQQF